MPTGKGSFPGGRIHMLDLRQLMSRRQEGEQFLTHLTKDEELILSNFALLTAKGMIQAGMNSEQSYTNIVLNAFMQGVALGLRIEVQAGKVVGRR
jgi:hypothetical protein